MIRIFYWIIFLLLIPILVLSDDINYGSFDNVEYVRNYDGDTITVNIKDVHPLIGSNISVRINGIDTPEMKSQCFNAKSKALEAKYIVENLCKTGKITLKNVNRDKYFRILSDVYVDNKKIADILIEKRLAIPYNGGTKIDWCE